jgi:uncharacterized membrane protein YqjE
MTQDTRLASRPSPPPGAEAEPSLGPLVSQLAQHSSDLIRQEIALAKAEVRQSLRQTASGAVRLGMATALLSVGGLVLTTFLVLLLGDLLDNYWVAALIVGVVFTIIGALLALGGIRRLKEVQMAPQETLETLKEDRDWARAEVQELKRDLKR